MASGARYRYKGHFISASKAASLHNLKHASKYITTEYTYKGKSDIVRKGYLQPISTRIQKALKPELRPEPVKHTKKQKLAIEQKHFEQIRIRRDAERIIRRAEREGIGFDEAADGVFDPESYSYYDFDDVMGYAADFAGDEQGLDFDMADLETDERVS